MAAIPFQRDRNRKAGPSAALGMTSDTEERKGETYIQRHGIILRDLAKCLYES